MVLVALGVVSGNPLRAGRLSFERAFTGFRREYYPVEPVDEPRPEIVDPFHAVDGLWWDCDQSQVPLISLPCCCVAYKNSHEITPNCFTS